MVQYNSFSSFGWLETVGTEILDHVDIRLGDIRDRRSVDELADGADVICHLAALIAIPYSYQAPESYLATNAGGTLNVLEAARRHGTPTRDPHVDERGLRDGDERSHLRGSPAPGAVPVLGVEDRRRQAASRVITSASPFLLQPFVPSTRTDRDNRREPSFPRRSARSPPAARDHPRLAGSDARLQFRFRHRRRVPLARRGRR